jgi:hypothetical protein
MYNITELKLTEVVVVQVAVVAVTGSVVIITPAEWADDVDTLSDREIGTGNPGMDTCKQQYLNVRQDANVQYNSTSVSVVTKHHVHPYTEFFFPPPPCNPILFAICTSTFSEFCKQCIKKCRRALSSTPL